MRSHIPSAALILAFVVGCGQETPKQTSGNPLLDANNQQVKGPNLNLPTPKKEELKSADTKKDAQPQPKDIKSKVKGKGLVQSIRGAATRPQRQNDLKQIGTYYQLFVTEFNRKPKNDKEFIDYMGVPGGMYGKLITEGHYVLNHKVDMNDSRSVIAWEAVNDNGSFMAVRAGLAVELIPEPELEVLLGLR